MSVGGRGSIRARRVACQSVMDGQCGLWPVAGKGSPGGAGTSHPHLLATTPELLLVAIAIAIKCCFDVVTINAIAISGCGQSSLSPPSVMREHAASDARWPRILHYACRCREASQYLELLLVSSSQLWAPG